MHCTGSAVSEVMFAEKGEYFFSVELLIQLREDDTQQKSVCAQPFLNFEVQGFSL